MPSKPKESEIITVHSCATGEQLEGRHMYMPLLAEVLVAPLPLYFTVYELVDNKHLAPIFREEQTLAASIRRELLAPEHYDRRFFIRLDQREALLRYEKDSIQSVLEDEGIPTQGKCKVLQSLTTMLSKDMMEHPTVENVREQKDNIAQMVDFSYRNPDAMSAMLQLTHHDYYTYTHSVNVGIYGTMIALELYRDCPEHDLKEIAAGFFLHDIGKSQVASTIINKNGPLDDAEWEQIRKHPLYGFELLKSQQNLSSQISIIVRQHHEKMDGFGYPDALVGEDIHPYSRICSLADAFDALTARRSYKKAHSPFKALAIMKEEMYAQFDPDIFRVFVLLMRDASKPIEQ